jgi:hypothetical protein
MPAKLVDYAEYKTLYTTMGWTFKFDRATGRRDPKRGLVFDPPMGTFSIKLFTKVGAEVYQQIRLMTPRAPKFRGVSKTAVYFKWEGPDARDAVLVAADKIRDDGYDVTVTESVAATSGKYQIKLSILNPQE